MTGALGDGASGLSALRLRGGVTIVQDPHDAAHREMPVSAINRSRPDYVVPLIVMPALLEKLVHQPAGATIQVPGRLRFEVERAKG